MRARSSSRSMVRGQTGARVRRRGRGHGARARLEGLACGLPRRDAAVEHADVAMTQRVEHPPQARRGHARAIVVGDDRGLRADAQLTHPAREGDRVRQRMATQLAGAAMVGEVGVEVHEQGARDVAR